MYNIVSIDPSITCTGVVINGDPHAFASSKVALNKKKKFNKWFQIAADYADIHLTDVTYGNVKLYSDKEVAKLQAYDVISDAILETIKTNIDADHPTIVVMEGYSYASSSGPLIDLVTISTLIRLKILSIPDVRLCVVAPMTVKMMAGALTYEMVKKGKVVTYVNPDGIKSGSFKKHQMFETLIHNDALQSDWVNFIRGHDDTILSMSTIPKPIEDINDAMVIYEYAASVVSTCGDDWDLFQKTLSFNK